AVRERLGRAPTAAPPDTPPTPADAARSALGSARLPERCQRYGSRTLDSTRAAPDARAPRGAAAATRALGAVRAAPLAHPARARRHSQNRLLADVRPPCRASPPDAASRLGGQSARPASCRCG